MVTGEDIAAFMGRSDDAETIALADQTIPVITAMARAYTRGQGFQDGEPNEELAAVITTATARLVANPTQLQYKQSTGPFSESFQTSFKGWILAETFILNRYRKRAL